MSIKLKLLENCQDKIYSTTRIVPPQKNLLFKAKINFNNPFYIRFKKEQISLFVVIGTMDRFADNFPMSEVCVQKCAEENTFDMNSASET